MQYNNSEEKEDAKERLLIWLIIYESSKSISGCKQVRHLFTVKMVLTAVYCIIEAIDLFYFKIPGNQKADFYSQLWSLNVWLF